MISIKIPQNFPHILGFVTKFYILAFTIQFEHANRINAKSKTLKPKTLNLNIKP